MASILLNSAKNSSYRFKRAMHLLLNKAYVNGEWIPASSNKTFDVRNPANNEVLGSVPDMNASDVECAIQAAHAAFQTWQNTSGKERSILLRKWYDLMVANSEELAKILHLESGKPLIEGKGEVGYGNGFVDWFSEEARRITGEIVASPVNSKKMLVERFPIGVAALITPWNFPHAMITRKAGAALASGCTCVIKPAEDTPLTALAIVKLAEQAGFPPGVINVITCDRGNAAEVGSLLCTHKNVAGISFTGSTEVGKLLYKQCASGVKRIALELGGDAPFIVFPSANLDQAVAGAMAAKFRNCGQTCVAANRFLVHKEVHDSFVEKLKCAMQKIQYNEGDCATVGPLINKAQFTRVAAKVDDALSKGAQLVLGGKPATLGGLYYEPTLLVNVTTDMEVYKEEIFGPIVGVTTFGDEDEAICMANSSDRGLAAYFYTQDMGQAFRVAKRIEAGMVGVNEGMISAPEAAFGGIKESGIGREGSHHGIEEYTYYKYICIGNLN